MFVIVSHVNPNGATNGAPGAVVSPLLSNIRLGCKILAVKNSLAYSPAALGPVAQ